MDERQELLALIVAATRLDHIQRQTDPEAAAGASLAFAHAVLEQMGPREQGRQPGLLREPRNPEAVLAPPPQDLWDRTWFVRFLGRTLVDGTPVQIERVPHQLAFNAALRIPRWSHAQGLDRDGRIVWTVVRDDEDDSLDLPDR